MHGPISFLQLLGYGVGYGAYPRTMHNREHQRGPSPKLAMTVNIHPVLGKGPGTLIWVTEHPPGSRTLGIRAPSPPSEELGVKEPRAVPRAEMPKLASHQTDGDLSFLSQLPYSQ